MQINIPTNDKKIFEQYFMFMNAFFNLTPNEIKLIAAVLSIYKETEGAKENIRWGYVFSKEGRDMIEEQSEMNKNQINLTLSALSKKEYQGHPLLLKQPYKALNQVLCIDPIADPEIHIHFIFQNTTNDIKPQAAEDNNRDRGEVQPIEEGEPETMGTTVSYDEGEDSDDSEEEPRRTLPPGYFSSYHAQ